MKNTSIIFIVIMLFSSLTTGHVEVYADNHVPNNSEEQTDASNNTEEETDVENATNNIQLTNPLGGEQNSIDSIPELVEAILRIVLSIGTPLVALAIIYAGFKFVTAQGNPEALKEARRTLLYVVIGAGILLGAYIIAQTIVGTIDAIRS